MGVARPASPSRWWSACPPVPKDRYYVLQWIDLFTQNFAYIGVRSTGFGAGNYMIAGPKWKGRKPEGIKEVFRAETDIVGTPDADSAARPRGRCQRQGDPGAIQVAAALRLPETARAAGSARDRFPPYDKAKARTHDFIGYLNFLLQFAEPPVASEVGSASASRRSAIGPGEPWDASKVNPATLAAIDAGVKEGQAEIDALAAKTFTTYGLFGSRAAVEDQLPAARRRRDEGSLRQFARGSLVRRLRLTAAGRRNSTSTRRTCRPRNSSGR